MAGVTPNGYVTKTQQEIVESITQRIEQKFGKDFPTSPDSVAGQYTNIIAAALKENWDLGQAVVDTGNRSKSEGVYLDYLAGLIGLSRRQAQGSNGDLVWTDNVNTFVPSFSVVKDNLDRKVLTQENATLIPSECYTAYIEIFTLSDNTEYSVSVNGAKYLYTSSSPAVKEDILNSLSAQIDTATNFSSSVEDERIFIQFDSLRNGMGVGVSSNMGIDKVGAVISAEAATSGALEFPANTITTVVSSFPDSEVTNPVQFDLGRFRETDAELRLRMEQREENTGTATVPAIEASVSEIPGVQGVIVTENRTMNTVNNIPPKSYETYVVGGDEDSIAQVVWDTKPAGIETYGNITKVITDNDDELQTVKFSRKAVLYAWVKVTYSLNPEEEVNVDPPSAIKTAVVDHGDNMVKDEDFDLTKFYGPIYSNVNGVYVDSIEIATTASVEDIPTYQTTRIPVGGTQYLAFDEDRVEVVL